MKKIIVDAQTGIQTEIDLTENEISIEQAEINEWNDGELDRSLNNFLALIRFLSLFMRGIMS